MRIQVYQINPDRDKNGLKFMSRATLRKLTGIDMADESLYDEVFDGDVDCSNLEEIFRSENPHDILREENDDDQAYIKMIKSV